MECVQECCYEVPIILCLTEVNVCREGEGEAEVQTFIRGFHNKFRA